DACGVYCSISIADSTLLRVSSRIFSVGSSLIRRDTSPGETPASFATSDRRALFVTCASSPAEQFPGPYRTGIRSIVLRGSAPSGSDGALVRGYALRHSSGSFSIWIYVTLQTPADNTVMG